MRLWRRIAITVSPEKAVLDIGDFRGEYALAARRVNDRVPVYAFEPNPHTLEVLGAACEGKGVEVIGVAVAEQNGSMPFLCSSAQSRMIGGVLSYDTQDQVCNVPTVTLDSWTSEHAVMPSLIKIDVEGAEAAILHSAQRVLLDYQPIILCEILTDWAGDQVMATLPPNYRFSYIDENVGTEERSRIKRYCWRNMNWLLMPEHKYAEVCT
jgi:FkbM family methyltransferase